MAESHRPLWPLIVMLIVYGLLALATGALMLIGMMFMNEPSGRNAEATEWLMIAAPFLLTMTCAGGTLALWLWGQRLAAGLLFGAAMLIVIFGGAMLFGFGLVI